MKPLSFYASIGLAAALYCGCGAAAQAGVLANSTTDFSDIQDPSGWQYGYRNVTVDGMGASYDPLAAFIPFISPEQWADTHWQLNTAGGAPWTMMGATDVHPNGLNNGAEHWAIRRWTAASLVDVTPLAITWHTAKANTSGGNGVTGGVYTNGVRADSATIAYNDSVGVTRTIYINASFGDIIDLVLSPVGVGGASDDGADGSVNSMVIDTTIPPIPLQPDGRLFVPFGAPDTDGDGLPDVWEMYYAGNLTDLSGTGDYDKDGLTDLEEYQRGTNPMKADSDEDGLSDKVETNTGLFVDSNDTGTDPLNPDTDGDGDQDGAEVAQNSDPLNPNTRPIIADSVAEFSNTQGQNDWFYGYRDLSLDGGGQNYDPLANFIEFPGTAWSLHTVAGDPWTAIWNNGSHPNGANSGHINWALRRWIANELSQTTPVVLIWHAAKQADAATCAGNGVTVGIWINGQVADHAAIAGGDTTGVTRRFYANLKPGDIVDLAHSPVGPTGLDDDGCDGSFTTLLVDLAIPTHPVQPDGSPFIPANAGDSDADGMPDAWEYIYFPGDLTKLTATGDYDGDGLKDVDEYARGSDPTKADTDGDGLSDLVETGTGIYVSPTDTGSSPTKADTDGDGLSDLDEVMVYHTDPNKADTDGDGYSDSAEVADGTDPNNPADNTGTYTLADSIKQFSGVQGQDNMFFGYRDYTADGGGETYDPDTGFLEFTPAQWTGTQWQLNTAGGAPWTFLASQALHPNSIDSGPSENWTIRRWVASSLASPMSVAVVWHIDHTGTCGDGVTGLLYVNGQKQDEKVIAWDDHIGVTRKYYLNLNPGDKIDLALSPVGVNGRNGYNDWCDASVTWFRVDTRIPKEPRQPDGTLFIPASVAGVDTDHDGLLDFWELIYAPDLTVLTGTGDNDNDGLNNLGEEMRDSDPTKADTDGDGLTDLVETATGIFVSPTDTGTSPRKVDSDGDGYSDAVEIKLGTNPNDANSTPVIADSIKQFSGVQGQADMYFGYRDYTTDGGGDNYNPATGFLPFNGGVNDLDAWNGTSQQWTGSMWDLNTAAAAPWTYVAAQAIAPNSIGSGPTEQWAIRRWVANSLTKPAPVAVIWHVDHSGGCGDGVTGLLYLNGQKMDEKVIAWDDHAGTTRTYYLNLNPGDKVDVALSPVGTAGRANYNDWCDDSDTWFKVDSYIPPNPVQPDGTPFVPAGGTAPQLSTPAYNAAAGTVALTWTSEPGATYKVEATADLKTWATLQTGVPSGGAQTTYVDTLVDPKPAVRFYRVTAE